MYKGAFEYRGFKKIGGHCDLIKGGQRIRFRFSDTMLPLDLMLDSYWPDFQAVNSLQETSRLEIL